MLSRLWNAILGWFCTPRQQDPVPSGIYILRYSKTCIKIGMSKHIKRRLKSYKGY